MLRLENVVKHYRVGDGEIVRAADGVSLTASAGELVALYGPSGCDDDAVGVEPAVRRVE